MKPLEGIKVLEFSTMVTAAFAAMMMAEQGASVIKVEPPDIGDPMRHLATGKGGISALFANCNRRKQSIRINLREPDGQDLARRLAQHADVLLHNFRPGVMDRLKLGSERLRQSNPRLVYVAISVFGTLGPLKGAPAYDPIIQAHPGFAASQGRGHPTFAEPDVRQNHGLHGAASGHCSALYARAHPTGSAYRPGHARRRAVLSVSRRVRAPAR